LDIIRLQTSLFPGWMLLPLSSPDRFVLAQVYIQVVVVLHMVQAEKQAREDEVDACAVFGSIAPALR